MSNYEIYEENESSEMETLASERKKRDLLTLQSILQFPKNTNNDVEVWVDDNVDGLVSRELQKYNATHKNKKLNKFSTLDKDQQSIVGFLNSAVSKASSENTHHQ